MSDKHSHLTNVVIAVITVMGSVLGSYWVTYQQIEKPKIAMETQKNDIAGLQIVQDMRPSAEVRCGAVELNPLRSWRISCSVKNTGKYLSSFSLDAITAGLITDKRQRDFSPQDGGFEWIRPLSDGVVSLKPGDTSEFSGVIEFDNKKYVNGVNGEEVVVRVLVSYRVSSLIVDHMKLIFPDFMDLIGHCESAGITTYIVLRQSR